MEEVKEGGQVKSAEVIDNPIPNTEEVKLEQAIAPKKKAASSKKKAVPSSQEGKEKVEARAKATTTATKKAATPKEVKASKPKEVEVLNEVKDPEVKVAGEVMEIIPKREGKAALAIHDIKLVIGNQIVGVAAEGRASDGEWTLMMGQVDKFVGLKVIQPLSEGRSPDPRYSKSQIELYLLGAIKKKLIGVTILEFWAYPLLNGRLVVTKASGKYKGIEDSPICPYPLANSLTEQYNPTPVPAQVDIGDPIASQALPDSGVLLY